MDSQSYKYPDSRKSPSDKCCAQCSLDLNTPEQVALHKARCTDPISPKRASITARMAGVNEVENNGYNGVIG